MDNSDVKCKVFVSCGQHSAEERQIARSVCELLRAHGFNVYLAIDAQTILEINTGIIHELLIGQNGGARLLKTLASGSTSLVIPDTAN